MKVIILIILLSLPLNSVADSRLEAAKELVEVINLKQTMKSMTPVSADTAIKISPQLKPFRSTLVNFYTKVFTSSELINDFTKLYAKDFTAKELKEITAFYKTKTGKKALILLPKITQAGIKLGEEHTKKNVPELLKMIAKAKKEMN